MMITEKLYYSDSFIKSFQAKVLLCDKKAECYLIVLDKTAFFAEGGGQKADVGYIGESYITDVFEDSGVVYHVADKPVFVGSVYLCEIDWETRFKRMQQHSGEHIVSGVVHSLFGYDNVGFHMEDEYVTVDFNGELTREQLDFVENKANEAIYNNYPINCYFPDEEQLSVLDYRSKLELTENVRLVEIEETDLCACCAPHLKSTGQVGLIKILDFMRHRGGVRVTIKSGFDALVDYRDKYKSVYSISGLLSAKQAEITDAVKRVMNELEEVNRQFYDFRMSVAESKNNDFVLVNGISYIFVDGFDSDMMRQLCNAGSDKSKLCLVYCGDDCNGYSFIGCSHSINMKAFTAFHNNALSGRGGGRDNMIQGKVTANKNEIESFVNEIDLKEF